MAESQNNLDMEFLREDNLTEESKELISNLPMEKGWFGIPFYEYEGFWYIKRQLHGALSCQKHFKSLDNDILLATLPKSGTTWFKALIFALLNRKRYSDINYHPLLTTNPHNLVPFLELNLYINKDILPDLSSFSSPRFFSTHLPYISLPKSVKESACKVVYICRDPKDVFVSHWHFAKMAIAENEGTDSFEDCFEKFCRGGSPRGPFWDHALSYWKESMERPEKIMIVRYEEMKKQPAFHLKKLAEFVGCPFSQEEESTGVVDVILNLCSFEKLSNLEVNKNGKTSAGVENKAFFRRGEVGDGKTLLTNEMIERLNTITDNKLTKHGLSF